MHWALVMGACWCSLMVFTFEIDRDGIWTLLIQKARILIQYTKYIWTVFVLSFTPILCKRNLELTYHKSGSPGRNRINMKLKISTRNSLSIQYKILARRSETRDDWGRHQIHDSWWHWQGGGWWRHNWGWHGVFWTIMNCTLDSGLNGW